MIGGKPAEPYIVSNDIEEPLQLSAAAVLPPAESYILPEFHEDEPDSKHGSGEWFAPAIAIGSAVILAGSFIWIALPSLQSGMSPIERIQLIAAITVPLVLIAVLYLVAMRSSRAEAARFGRTAQAMRSEAAALERRIASLSDKIAENRAALAEQVDLLITMGDRAASQINEVAGTVTHQSQTLDTGTRNLLAAAADAERRVSTILHSLPKAHEEMAQMSARVDEAGLSAGQHAAALDAQLVALAERGRDAEHLAGGAAERLAAHIARMEATSQSASVRLEAVTGQMSTEVDDVLDRAAVAVDEARKGIASQGEAILAMLSANQAALDRASKDSAEALHTRITAIEEVIARVGERLGAEQNRGAALFDQLSSGVERLDQELLILHAGGTDRVQGLAGTVSALHASVDAMTEAMNVGDATAHKVIGTADGLLLALDASAREIDETLPDALERLDIRILASRQVVAGAKPELLALVTAAESTHDAIEAIAEVVNTQRDTLAKTQASLLETLATGGKQAQELGAIVDETIGTTRRFAEEAAPQLVDALLRVRETATLASTHAREAIAGIVPGATQALEEASTHALRRAVDGSVHRQLVELAQATEGAVSAASRASERLTQQMLQLADTTSQVEVQIKSAEAAREASDSDNFARRVTLLIEALNSTSIDLAKVFAADVSDSAWSAYLKGDRGVFTRRAVRVLDSGDAREIHRLYDEDDHFRDNVNRYIHDFEAMLRQILALRDGSPLGVTLLSSDMGKLYVALAQAIERLRN